VETIAPKFKICGLTRLGDAEHAAELGAWALGLILWPGSPRHCPPDVAAEIGARLRRQTEIVGVFVNPTLERLTRAAEDFNLSMLQLHGDEGPVFCAEAARRTGCRVIKAVRVQSGADIQDLTRFHTDLHLLDSFAKNVRGGSGETFAWELARGHRGPPMILSGGLRADNVVRAISSVQPYAVDVASGIESAPGVKDPAKLEAFAAAVAATAAVGAR
jgi:phosphoribosylanthranilate isomerase